MKLHSKNIKNENISGVFAILLDETTNASRKERVSICLRHINNKLDISEHFIGFYLTDRTDAASLFDIQQDVLTRLNLSFANCGGQYYDGAASVSGEFTGLQKRVRDIEPRAVFVHCQAHSLNLVVQDAITSIASCRNILNDIGDIINFVSHPSA